MMPTPITPNFAEQADRVRRWNNCMPVGAAVSYSREGGELISTLTRSRAQMLHGQTAVIFLDDIPSCVRLDRVTARGT